MHRAIFVYCTLGWRSQSVLAIAFGAAQRQIENGHAALDGLHIQLGFAQLRHQRHIVRLQEGFQLRGDLGAGVDAHADHADRHFVAPHRFHFRQLLEKLAAGPHVECRRHQRHHYLVNRAQCVFQCLAMQPGRGVEYRDPGAFGRARDFVVADVPAADLRQLRRAQLQPVAAGLLAVDVAEHRALFLPCEPRGEMCSQCRFAAAALGVGDQYPVHVSQSVEKWGCCAAHAKHRAAPVVAPAGIAGRLQAGVN